MKVSKNSDRRVGVDLNNEEFIVFDKSTEYIDGTIEYHGHSRQWTELNPSQQAALRKNFAEYISKSGKMKR